MANNNNGRVLQRMGARELTQEEAQKVAGSDLHTVATLLFTNAPKGGYDEQLDQ